MGAAAGPVPAGKGGQGPGLQKQPADAGRDPLLDEIRRKLEGPPERFGRHKCVSDRLRLWVRTGVWQPVLRELLALHILEEDDVPASLREEAGENPSQK